HFWYRVLRFALSTKETNHEQWRIAGADGCGDCGETFAEASVLSGLASREAEPRRTATICGTILPARGGVSETPASARGADGRAAAEIDPGEPGRARESGGDTSEAVAGFCGGGGCGRGRHYVLPWSAGDAGGGAEVPRNL